MLAKLRGKRGETAATKTAKGPWQSEQQAFWPEFIDDAQKQKLDKLRSNLESRKLLLPGTHLSTDTALLRFLKARAWDLAKAEAMYAEMMAWRKEFEADEVFQSLEFPERDDVLRLYPQYYSGTDRFGRPVYVEKTGLIDYAELTKVTTTDRVIKFHVHCYESLVREKFDACSKAAGREIFSTTTILDLAGLSLNQFYKCKEVLKKISRIDQDNYPEHLGAMVIINAPKIFTTIWSVVKPWLDSQTTSKIQILSTNYYQTLVEMIPEENIPSEYGGKSTKPAGVSFGPWISEDGSDPTRGL